MVDMDRDRFGLTWRPELAAGVFANLDRIDLVEVIADDYFDAPRRAVRALETLAAQIPVVLHGVGLGPASMTRVDDRRLDRMGRLIDRIHPASWSEHLAFVRADGIEIGHLAAPPRTPDTVEATAANLARARAITGAAPLVENIATLIDPPASTLDEADWVSAIVAASGCDLLLDLHNVHTNSVNFGFDPVAYLDRLDMDRIGAIHIAGGALLGERMLDDHLHDVPAEVYNLLTEIGARVPRSLTVILERDGAFPATADLLAQLDCARQALAAGRARLAASRLRATRYGGHGARGWESEGRRRGDGANERERPFDPQGRPELVEGRVSHAPELEAFLALLYTDAEARRRFVADPRGEAARAGMTDAECDALERIDGRGLELAARSFAHKRAGKKRAVRSRHSG